MVVSFTIFMYNCTTLLGNKENTETCEVGQSRQPSYTKPSFPFDQLSQNIPIANYQSFGGMKSSFNSSTVSSGAPLDQSANFLFHPSLALPRNATSGNLPLPPHFDAPHLGPPRSPPRPPHFVVPHVGHPRMPPRPPGFAIPPTTPLRSPPRPPGMVVQHSGPPRSPAGHIPLAPARSGLHGSPPRHPALFIPYAELNMDSTHDPGLALIQSETPKDPLCDSSIPGLVLPHGAPMLANRGMTLQTARSTVSSVLPPKLRTSAKKSRSAPFGSKSIRNSESAEGRSPNQIMADRTASEIEHEDTLKTELLVRF